VLVLASASPRRQELLRNAGIAFTVHSADVTEVPQSGESGAACAERLARAKALTVSQRRPNDLVLGADTVVVVGSEILGKPRDEADAVRMLGLLSGRTHQVTTGVCLTGAENRKLTTGFQDVRSETTRVTMNAITAEEIRSYVATGEPWDKAGAYAIQGIASRWIPKIEGDYFNVVGLPLSLVYQMLLDHGWTEGR
jgi:septum formation protein